MLTLVDYSEKAVAITGDTKAYKNELKAAGGRFNAKLSCGAGWIFSKKAVKALEAIMAKANGGEVPSMPEKKEENPLDGARVYVGTYHKYNSGSIAGKWLSLADYANRDEFYAACRELHKDEADPEFMFQDWEGVPSWMIGESHIDAEVWNQKPEKEQKGSQSKAEIRAILEKVLPAGRDIDYYVKETAAIVEAEGRYFDIDKPRIETRFCMDDESPNLDEWRKAVRTYKFFRDENLEKIEGTIKALESDEGMYIYRNGYTHLWEFQKIHVGGWYDESPEIRFGHEPYEIMSAETRAALLKGYKQVRDGFEKRLQTWWKKYGADKLHCWTYWANA